MLATGETHSVREFVELAFAEVGRAIEWRGKGVDETGVDSEVRQDRGPHRSALFPPDRSRPSARRCQQGAREARLEAARRTFAELVKEMVAGDLEDRASGRLGQWQATSV